MSWRSLLVPAVWVLGTFAACAAEPVDPALQYRTDSANAHLPWYQLKPGEFPPRGSAHRIGGDLVEADFIHRAGVFRMDGSGELVSFTMPPFATVNYVGGEGDLRDLPLGTHGQWFLFQDAKGAFTRLATVQDDFTALAAQGVVYRVEEVKLGEGKLRVTTQPAAGAPAGNGAVSPPSEEVLELLIDPQARVWKGAGEGKLADLAVGDSILANTSGSPARCTELWLGADAQQRATKEQRQRHLAFIKTRGLPAWVDRVEGKKMTLTFFGEPASFAALCKDEGLDPAKWATEHRRVGAAVANEELRTYNPKVDQQGSNVLEYESVPADRYGSSGVRWTIQPSLLLEGFRRGHVVRIFKDNWPIFDMPYGESVYGEVFNAETIETDPHHYPFRTDFANEGLPWYQLQPGKFPPNYSGHEVGGALVKIDTNQRGGQFRADRTGELINFTLPPFAAVLYCNAEADLTDIPIGTRCLFSLHQDSRGVFTQASQIVDEFTNLTKFRLSCRLDAVRLTEGKLLVAQQIPPMKDERDVIIQPPDLGRMEIAVDEQTRVWKGDRKITLGELMAGDQLIFNRTARTSTSQGRCTDLWVDRETHKTATEEQRARRQAVLKERGRPAWIESVDGKKVTVIFFAASRVEYAEQNRPDPKGKTVQTLVVNDQLQPIDAATEKMKVVTRLPEPEEAGLIGTSNTRWQLEAKDLPATYRSGQVIRVVEEPPPAPANP
jgi:hypothetical protein